MYPYRLLPSPVPFPSPAGPPAVAGQRPRSRPAWPRLALAAVAAILLASCAPLAVLPASAVTVLLVSPNSIRAGFAVTVRATCGDNVNPAFVSSGAFGSVTLVPSHGLLSSSVVIPPSTRPGTYSVRLSCASGQTSSAALTVLGGVGPNPHVGPRTGGGEMASTAGAGLALFGGLGAIAAGLGIWVLSLFRRRAAVVR